MRKSGFTIIEVLVTVSVISLLCAILLPAVQRAREAARATQCRNQIRQLALALHMYHDTHSVLPPGSQVQDLAAVESPFNFTKGYGWTVAILPYIERNDLYNRFDFDLDCQIHHRFLTNQQIVVFVCPSDPVNSQPTFWNRQIAPGSFHGAWYRGDWGVTSYFGVSGTDRQHFITQPSHCDSLSREPLTRGLHSGVFFGNSRTRFADISDGLSQTLLLGERGGVPQTGKWGGPGSGTSCPFGLTDVLLPGLISGKGGEMGGLRAATGRRDDDIHWWSWHAAGTHFALADGSVRIVSTEIDRSVLKSLSDRCDGVVVGDGW